MNTTMTPDCRPSSSLRDPRGVRRSGCAGVERPGPASVDFGSFPVATGLPVPIPTDGAAPHVLPYVGTPVWGTADGGSRHREAAAVGDSSSATNLFFRGVPKRISAEQARGLGLLLPGGGGEADFDERMMRHFCAQFGPILSLAIMRNIHTGESRGTAFVRYETHEAAKAAHAFFTAHKSLLPGDTVPLVVQWARREHDSAPAAMSEAAKSDAKKVFIRNIPMCVRDHELIAVVQPFGEVATVTLHSDTAAERSASDSRTDARPGRHHAGEALPDGARQIAFVTFNNPGEAVAACAGLHSQFPFGRERQENIPLLAKIAEDSKHRRMRKSVKSSSAPSASGSCSNMSLMDSSLSFQHQSASARMWGTPSPPMMASSAVSPRSGDDGRPTPAPQEASGHGACAAAPPNSSAAESGKALLYDSYRAPPPVTRTRQSAGALGDTAKGHGRNSNALPRFHYHDYALPASSHSHATATSAAFIATAASHSTNNYAHSSNSADANSGSPSASYYCSVPISPQSPTQASEDARSGPLRCLASSLQSEWTPTTPSPTYVVATAAPCAPGGAGPTLESSCRSGSAPQAGCISLAGDKAHIPSVSVGLSLSHSASLSALSSGRSAVLASNIVTPPPGLPLPSVFSFNSISTCTSVALPAAVENRKTHTATVEAKGGHSHRGSHSQAYSHNPYAAVHVKEAK